MLSYQPLVSCLNQVINSARCYWNPAGRGRHFTPHSFSSFSLPLSFSLYPSPLQTTLCDSGWKMCLLYRRSIFTPLGWCKYVSFHMWSILKIILFHTCPADQDFSHLSSHTCSTRQENLHLSFFQSCLESERLLFGLTWPDLGCSFTNQCLLSFYLSSWDPLCWLPSALVH